MKKYTFRLQTVLDMREKTLEAKRLEMAKVIKLLNEQNDILEELKQKKSTTRADLNTVYKTEDTLDIIMLTNYKNYLAKVDNDIRNQELTIENTKKVLNEKQFEVSMAHKEVKVMETLKEKQETAFYRHIDEVTAKELDDIATTRYKVS